MNIHDILEALATLEWAVYHQSPTFACIVNPVKPPVMDAVRSQLRLCRLPDDGDDDPLFSHYHRHHNPRRDLYPWPRHTLPQIAAGLNDM